MTDLVAPFTSLAPDNRPEPRTAFDHALHRLLDDMFQAYPTWATHTGFHAFDDRWHDPTEAGRSARLAMLRHHRARLQALPEEELTPDERIDRGIVLEQIDAYEFEDAELRESAWDPLSIVYLAGSGFFGLLTREFAPWQHRGAAFVGRARGLGQMLGDAGDALTGLPGRPVSLLHSQTALAQLQGVSDLLDQGLAEAERRGAEPGATHEDRQIAAALAREAPAAKAAVDEFGRRLRDEVTPRAEGDGRLGPELFQRKLRHTLASDIAYAEYAERGHRDYLVVRAEMLRLAREAWPKWLPNATMPAGDEAGDEIIRRVLDAVALVHRQPHELLEASREEVRQIEEFCRANDVIGLPEDPLEITWTPVFMRAYGGAFLESPGALDKGLSSNFWITPPDEALGPDAVESYMREENNQMLKLLAVHEAVPGHYLQGAWANRSPSLTRAVFEDGMFAEGWAVYVTQVMMDLGYGDHDPALLLNHWKFYLRAITNALMDVAIHTEGMTEDQAMDLMVRGGFQEEDEARRKWLRARITSTQLSTYYLGLDRPCGTWRSRRAVVLLLLPAGRPRPCPSSASSVALERRLISTIEPTSNRCISHGSPPIKWVSRILFES